jgi:hypothetical protein
LLAAAQEAIRQATNFSTYINVCSTDSPCDAVKETAEASRTSGRAGVFGPGETAG